MKKDAQYSSSILLISHVAVVCYETISRDTYESFIILWKCHENDFLHRLFPREIREVRKMDPEIHTQERPRAHARVGQKDSNRSLVSHTVSRICSSIYKL